MSYCRSSARIAFDDRVSQLKKSAKNVSSYSGVIDGPVRDLVFHAAILETSAAIEEYIKELLEDYDYKLRSGGVKLSLLPGEMKTYLLLREIRPHFENYILSRDERKALRKMGVDSGLFGVLDRSAPFNGRLKTAFVLEEKKYPSPKNWVGLFFRIGVRDIFSELGCEIQRNAKDMLQSFNDVRTALAHGQPPPMTYSDVERNLDDMMLLVRGVDRVLFRHFSRHSGRDTWPRYREF